MSTGIVTLKQFRTGELVFFILAPAVAALVGATAHFLNKGDGESAAQIKPGDVLRVSRTWYWHYGVYVGNDEVIHYTSADSDVSPENVVQTTSMSKFIGSAPMFEVLGFPNRIRHGACFGPEATAQRARNQIGENAYSLSSNNCQHFAIWCKTGQRFSGQMPIGAMASASLNAALWPDLLWLKGITVARRVDAKRRQKL